MEIETVQVDDLRHDDRNARTHSVKNLAAIAASLRKWGQQKPIVVDKGGKVVAGNGTLEAARALGWTEVQVVRTKLRGRAARAYALADNRTAELAEWNLDELAEQMRDLGEFDGELAAATGFTDADLAELVGVEDPPGAGAGTEPTPPEPDIPDPPTDPITKPGQILELGRHRVWCADSLTSDLSTVLEGRPADCVFTDPPFAIYGSSSGVASDVADDKMVRPFFRELGKVIRSNARSFAHVYACCDWRSYPALSYGFADTGLGPRNVLIWDKGDFGLGVHWGNAHEFVAFFANMPADARRGTSLSKHGKQQQRAVGQRQVSTHVNILRFPRVSGDERVHNASKPVALVSRVLEHATDEGETVLDLFGGGGSTLIAAEKTGRRAVLLEIEPGFCDVIAERWEKLTGQEAVRRDG